MAHPKQLQFVKTVASLLTSDYQSKKVLEIGSYDVTGSICQFFPHAHYTGVDLIDGPSVDLICEGDKIPHEDNTYDITISCECFEHNPAWAETFKNMHRMTKDGGLVIFTCATTGRHEHGTTRSSPKSSPGTQALKWDYYENLTEEDFHRKLSFPELFREHFFLINRSSCDLYFLGAKGQSTSIFPVNTSDIQKACLSDQEDLQNKMMSRKQREKYIPKPLRKTVRKLFPKKFGDNPSARLIKDF